MPTTPRAYYVWGHNHFVMKVIGRRRDLITFLDVLYNMNGLNLKHSKENAVRAIKGVKDRNTVNTCKKTLITISGDITDANTFEEKFMIRPLLNLNNTENRTYLRLVSNGRERRYFHPEEYLVGEYVEIPNFCLSTFLAGEYQPVFDQYLKPETQVCTSIQLLVKELDLIVKVLATSIPRDRSEGDTSVEYYSLISRGSRDYIPPTYGTKKGASRELLHGYIVDSNCWFPEREIKEANPTINILSDRWMEKLHEYVKEKEKEYMNLEITRGSYGKIF